MGLSDDEIREITLGWNATMGAVQRAILDARGYTWSLMHGQACDPTVSPSFHDLRSPVVAHARAGECECDANPP